MESSAAAPPLFGINDIATPLETSLNSVKGYSLGELFAQFRTGVPREQLARLADQTPVNAAVTLSLVAVISVFVLVQIPAPLMIVWAPLNAGLAVVVLVRWWRMREHGDSLRNVDMRPTRKGLRNAMLFGTLSGGMWGSLAALLPGMPQHIQFALILCMGGMAAGASTTLAAVPQVAVTFILGCSLPLISYFFWLGDASSLLMAASFTIFTSAMIGTSQLVYAALLRQLKAEKQAQYLRETQLQQKVATAANEAANLDDALQVCLDEICHYIGWPAGHVYLLADDGSGDLVSSDIWHFDVPEQFAEFRRITRGTRFPAGSGLPGRVLASGEPIWKADSVPGGGLPLTAQELIADPTFPRAKALIESGIRAVACYPIRVGAEIVGVMEMFTESLERPSGDLNNLLETVATQLGRSVERHRSEQELRASELKFRALVENSNQGLAIHAGGKPLYINDEGARIVGRTAEEFMALDTIFDAVHPDHRERLLNYQRDRVQGGDAPSIYEFMGQRPDGSEVPLLTKVSPIKWEGKDAFLMAVVDMTEQRQTEAQLHQAQKMEAVGQLTSGIAHDFNNVLAVVTGNLELAMESLGDDEWLNDLISSAMEGAQKGADLNKQLLTFSRQEEFDEKICDINQIIKGTTGLIRRTLGETIEIEPQLVAEACFSKVDPAQLESAILNLSINARDAMAGGGRLTIKTGIVDSGSVPGAEKAGIPMVRICICDTGSGMSADVLEHALEPFYTTKEAGLGTGLGLAMVYGFAQKSGGQMDIDSEVGKGTDIRLYLPLSEASEDSPLENKRAEVEKESLGGELILVVEDQEAVMKVVSRHLESLGYRVITAANGREALAAIGDAKEPIDLVLSDMVLPGGLDGAQVIEAAKKFIPGVKAVLMSGYLGQPDGVERHDLSHIPLLRKPFKKADLAKILTENLSQP